MLREVLWILIVPKMYSDIVSFMCPLMIATAIRKQRSLPEPGYRVAMSGQVKPRPDIK